MCPVGTSRLLRTIFWPLPPAAILVPCIPLWIYNPHSRLVCPCAGFVQPVYPHCLSAMRIKRSSLCETHIRHVDLLSDGCPAIRIVERPIGTCLSIGEPYIVPGNEEVFWGLIVIITNGDEWRLFRRIDCTGSGNPEPFRVIQMGEYAKTDEALHRLKNG